jgi:hypothetical protein
MDMDRGTYSCKAHEIVVELKTAQTHQLRPRNQTQRHDADANAQQRERFGREGVGHDVLEGSQKDKQQSQITWWNSRPDAQTAPVKLVKIYLLCSTQ